MNVVWIGGAPRSRCTCALLREVLPARFSAVAAQMGLAACMLGGAATAGVVAKGV